MVIQFTILKKIKIILKNKNIAFLPGSRLSELDKLFPYFQNAYEYLLNLILTQQFLFTLEHLKPKIIKLTKNWKLKIIISTNSLEIEKLFKLFKSLSLFRNGKFRNS